MLVRDGEVGLEVFMVQRTHRAAFARSTYVFPGGQLDDADHGTVFESISDHCDDASASARLGLDHGGLAWLVAAIRECFEEAGILLARRVRDDEPIRFDTAEVIDQFTRARRGIHNGEVSLAQLCRDHELRLLVDRIHLVDHWVTPLGERHRFDTRFFLALAPAHQRPLHDHTETIASCWIRPADAIARSRSGKMAMFPPTIRSLEFIASYATVADLVEDASHLPIPTPIVPRLITDDEGRIVEIKNPGDEGYDEVIDPEWVIGHHR